MKAKKQVPKVSSAQRKKLLKSLQNSAEPQGAGSPGNQTDRHRIVVDTSVLISAVFFDGKEQVVLRHIAKHHTLIISDYILRELLAFAKHTLPKTPRRLITAMRQTFKRFVYDYDERAVTVRDINDIPILQLAIEHEALIISSDKDLLEYKSSAHAPILSTSEYKELFISNQQ